MTTLGFGDFTPLRPSGRIAVVCQLLTALAFISIVLQGVMTIAFERPGDRGGTR
jgi:hypothetical protein